MPKIKDIIERLHKTPLEYSNIRFLSAKRTAAFFIAFYFTASPFLIGGFSFFFISLPILSQIVYHTYSVLIIVIGWFLYEFSVYISEIYTSGKKWPIFAGGILALIFVVFNLLVYLGN